MRRKIIGILVVMLFFGTGVLTGVSAEDEKNIISKQTNETISIGYISVFFIVFIHNVTINEYNNISFWATFLLGYRIGWAPSIFTTNNCRDAFVIWGDYDGYIGQHFMVGIFKEG